MRVRWLLLIVVAVTVLGSAGATRQMQAAPAKPAALLPADCTEIDRPDVNAVQDYKWKICFPPAPIDWNDSVVVWAHGYEAPGFAETYQDVLVDGTSVPDILTNQGYAFITTTYPSNGLAVLEAKTDLLALVDYFTTTYDPTPDRKVYLAGNSMGGLITTQLAEQTTGKFDGALSGCGIVGDMQRQIKYWGHFNSLYRVFFGDVVAGWPPPPPGITTTKEQWDTIYQPAVIAGVTSNITATQLLLATSKAAYDPLDPTSVVTTIAQLAYFTFLSPEDAALRLGGNPFENRTYWYWGTPNDFALNRAVPRLAASPAALTALQAYETTGRPTIPLVVVHTNLDPAVPVDQALIYFQKVPLADIGVRVFPLMVKRYGHCTFNSTELGAAFALLVSVVTEEPLPPGGSSPFMTQEEMLAEAQRFAAAEAAEAAQQAQHSFRRLLLPEVHQYR